MHHWAALGGAVGPARPLPAAAGAAGSGAGVSEKSGQTDIRSNVRITLARNDNRSVKTVAVVNARSELKGLRTVSKNKLR